ncbi:MAG TPA: HDOD domain-containing protein [Clostridia bacterium]|jgi:HD-like signal output (HDOD) protein
MNKSILLVDDERPILAALKRAFAGNGFDIFLAESGEEALSFLAKKVTDLVITDVRMPEMNGYQLLKEIRANYPSIIRVVLSGYSDEDLVIRIQRESLAKRYLLKPWKNQELIRTVEQIFSVEEALKKRNLLELMNRIEFLPSPSDICIRLNRLAEQDAGIDEIARTIESDQSLTAKILQVANSSGHGMRTGSVRQAIDYLGLTNVMNILLSAAAFNNDRAVSNIRIKKDIEVLWKHAVLTNDILAYLYRRIAGHPIPDMCSTAGLLHDIGKVVLIYNYTGKYLKAAAAIRNRKDMYYYYEKMEFIDITHQEIGAYLLNWWELPQVMVESALYHHDPLDENVTDKEVMCLLNVADICSWSFIYGDDNLAVDPKVLEHLDVTRDDLDRIIRELQFCM